MRNIKNVKTKKRNDLTIWLVIPLLVISILTLILSKIPIEIGNYKINEIIYLLFLIISSLLFLSLMIVFFMFLYEIDIHRTLNIRESISNRKKKKKFIKYLKRKIFMKRYFLLMIKHM